MKSEGNRSRVLVSAHPAGEGSRCRTEWPMTYNTTSVSGGYVCHKRRRKGKKR